MVNKLQRLQNSLAKTVLHNPQLSATEHVRNLHWLPVNDRIKFKIAVFTYTSCWLLTNYPILAHSYQLINLHAPSDQLIGSSLLFLRCRTVFGKRAFSVSSPTVWNDVPSYIKSSSVSVFRKRLKNVWLHKTLHLIIN